MGQLVEDLLSLCRHSRQAVATQIVHLDRIYLPSLTKGRDPVAMLTYGVTCTAAAGFLYLCIERPFMVLRDRLDKRQQISVEDAMLNEPAL